MTFSISAWGKCEKRLARLKGTPILFNTPFPNRPLWLNRLFRRRRRKPMRYCVYAMYMRCSFLHVRAMWMRRMLMLLLLLPKGFLGLYASGLQWDIFKGLFSVSFWSKDEANWLFYAYMPVLSSEVIPITHVSHESLRGNAEYMQNINEISSALFRSVLNQVETASFRNWNSALLDFLCHE